MHSYNIDCNMRKKLVSAILVLLVAICQAQPQTFTLTGKVVDAASGNPVPAASVFLSNTSIGTAANDKGLFTLHNAPGGKYDLVVSSLGYATFFKTINITNAIEPLTIQLQQKANELAGVVIGTYDKDGWQRWSRTFIQDFIGTSSNADNCEIKNDTVIKFHYSQKRNELTAFADEAIIIVNSTLGYTIHYKLENFSHNFNNNTISYEGFPLFEQMDGNLRKKHKWDLARKDAYYGSIMHFMRCLFVNKLLENGYEVRRLEKKVNAERRRVQALYTYLKGADGDKKLEGTVTKDSLDYYNRILAEPKEFDVLHPQILPGDSIAFGGDSVTAVFAFKDYLQIMYKNKKEEYEYRSHLLTPDSPNGYITSLATLINRRAIYVSYNGAYYDPQDLLTSGYWGWSDKACNMLPFDYWPD